MASNTETPVGQRRDEGVKTGTGIDWQILSIALAALLVAYYLVPILSLLIAGSPTATLQHVTRPYVVSAVLTSLVSATTSTLLAVIFGLPLAYWLSRTSVRGQRAVITIVLLPLVLPPIVSGMVLLEVFGPDALGGLAQRTLNIRLTRSLAGVVLAQMFVASPFLVITAKAAFDGVDRSLEHASRTLGKDRRTTLRNVTLPLARPGILAGVTLTFTRAIGEFGATIMMAYYPRTMPVQIWVTFLSHGIDAALPIAVVLLGIAVAVLLVVYRLDADPWGET